MKFEYLDHTADAKFRAYGKTLEEAFINSAIATFSILINTDKVKPVITKDISITSGTAESLLYDFLEELLYLLDVEGFLLSRVEDMRIENNNLTCKVYGDSHKKYRISGNIKSITYNDMEIKKTDKGYRITAVVDI